ncbi:hypothetical protein V5O48_005869 [Marasmius crinis-equi]|uniref:F-box domain-containing protein n=1 Tax=Marasmius crinis-equi TaxID=585013 RepID=A0ABR3FL85_9AGAR
MVAEVWIPVPYDLHIHGALQFNRYGCDRRRSRQSGNLFPSAGEFLDILIRHCHRWKNIAFGDAAHWHFTPAFERLTPADVPRLETVLTLGNVFLWRFLPGTDDRIRVPSALGRLLAAAPRLRTLHITDECISEQTLHTLAPDWSRLTELSISPPVALDFNAGRAVQTLAKTCHSVVSFSLDCAAYPGTSFDGAPDPPIEWPSIRKFAITLRNIERHPEHPTFIPEIVEIFDSVSLPSLEDFSASLFGRVWELHPPAMIFSVPWEGLLLRSRPSSITKLRLYFPAYLEPIAVLRSLQPLVGLKLLRAGNDYFGGAEEAQLLSSFAESAKYTSEELFAASLPELPELEECEFDGCVQENVEGLLDLAMRRGPKLRILRAHFMVTTGVDVEAFMPSEQVVQDRDISGSSEEGRLTGYVHGVKLVWTWRAQNEMSHDTHDAGMPATPFARFLGTNHAPSEEEQKNLLALIRNPEEKIRKLEEEISRLEAERDGLKSFVDRHRALLSPFRRLPADVWRGIFICCLPNNKLGLCTRTTSEAPLLLTTICRSWRDIALSTPRLWNSIHIYLPTPRIGFDGERFQSAMQARNEGFRRWLEKSGSLPLTISLSTGEAYVEPGLTVAHDYSKLRGLRTELIDMLARYCRRWKIMAFGEATLSIVANAFGRLTTQDLPLLESIHTNGNVFLRQDFVTGESNPIRLSAIGSLLSRASSLRALQLTGEFFSEQSLLSDLPLSWSRLTELRISRPSGHYGDCYELLHLLAKECHSLVTLDLYIQSSLFYQEHGGRPSSPLEWPSIQKYAISFIGSAVDRHSSPVPVFTQQVVEAFESVNLPSLKEFSVDIVDSAPPSSAISSAPWELLLLRSQPAITHIQLAFPPLLDAQAVLRSLQPLDTLKSLQLGHGDEYWQWSVQDEELLHAFIEAGTSLCPDLEEVEFGGCGPESAKSLLDLAARRPKLRLIRAHFLVSEGEVETFLPSEQVVDELKVSRTERKGTLRGYIKGVRLIWTWRSHDDPSREYYATVIPGDTRYW